MFRVSTAIPTFDPDVTFIVIPLQILYIPHVPDERLPYFESNPVRRIRLALHLTAI